MSLIDDVSSIRQRGAHRIPNFDHSSTKEIGRQRVAEKDKISQVNWVPTFSMTVIPILLAFAALSFLVPSSFSEYN
jgi:hypothetical protein